MASVTYDHVTKRFDGTAAVQDFTVQVADGEFLVLVGPSGCGKSTALRMLAGLEEITEGRILIGERAVNNLAPGARDVAMVFQSYALYPHMTVYDNLAFGLRNKRFPKAEVDRRVRRAVLALVGIGALALLLGLALAWVLAGTLSRPLRNLAGTARRVEEGDLDAIRAPIDFLGVNNYSRNLVQADPDGGPAIDVRQPDAQYTDMDWEVYPDGIHDLLVRIGNDYAPRALYITENGAAFPDVRGHDGSVRDPERRDYLEEHIAAVGRAVEAGVPVKGYFVWTLMDNFEWAWG